jgi:hypothetical protein
VIFCDRSPFATAVVTSAMLRPERVKEVVFEIFQKAKEAREQRKLQHSRQYRDRNR